MTKSNSSTTPFNYEPFGTCKADFNKNAFELETIAIARREVNKVEMQQGFSWDSMHLDVPAMVIDIIKKSVKGADKGIHSKKAKATGSHLIKKINQIESTPTKSKIIADNNVSKWVNDYFQLVIESLVDSITLVRSENKPGDEKSGTPSEHMSECRIIQDGNEWLLTVETKGFRPTCMATMNGIAINQEGVSNSTQWIAALFSSACINLAYKEVLSFYKEAAHLDNENVCKAKAIAACIGGNYYDYLILVDGFESARQSITSMPDDLINAKADYMEVIKTALDVEPSELQALIKIFAAKPLMQ